MRFMLLIGLFCIWLCISIDSWASKIPIIGQDGKTIDADCEFVKNEVSDQKELPRVYDNRGDKASFIGEGMAKCISQKGITFYANGRCAEDSTDKVADNEACISSGFLKLEKLHLKSKQPFGSFSKPGVIK